MRECRSEFLERVEADKAQRQEKLRQKRIQKVETESAALSFAPTLPKASKKIGGAVYATLNAEARLRRLTSPVRDRPVRSVSVDRAGTDMCTEHGLISILCCRRRGRQSQSNPPSPPAPNRREPVARGQPARGRAAHGRAAVRRQPEAPGRRVRER